jgi:N-succinyl-L-ornithine transcarbamylase
MKNYTSIKDIKNLNSIVEEAIELKKNPFQNSKLGKNKTIILVFFNSSLRTRLSTQKAAMNLGMNVMVLDINKDSWKLETEQGVIMDQDKAEHINEAIPVIASYCDIIAVRSFASLELKKEDYEEKIIQQFIQLSGKPVVSLESATRHPLQSLADVITIEEHKTVKKPKVVLTWAPHPRALPQAVANSFAEFINETDYEFIITHPKGYELAPEFAGNAKIEYDQKEAFKDADFIYAKNWSSYNNYGEILSTDKAWTVNEEKMALTNNAKFLHCLPVRRNMIVTDGVIESKNSLVYKEAENRVYSAQIVLQKILQNI